MPVFFELKTTNVRKSPLLLAACGKLWSGGLRVKFRCSPNFIYHDGHTHFDDISYIIFNIFPGIIRYFLFQRYR
ncbi:MAG: hypothetical protein D6714_02000, partial [Bacteroidetes bacterium]